MSSETGGVVVGPDPLATGPAATVYAGQLADTGAQVAVKLFADRFDRDTIAQLGRERQVLDALRSVRAILPVDGIVDHPDGRSGVRMELCQGSLAEVLAARDALPVNDALRVGLTVATALAAAHGKHLVHGSVTPHNVLFRRSGEPVLADFGSALREQFPRDPMHALEYTAPETLRDSIRTEATDLYGLGALLYAALVGTPPFARRTGQPPGERILRVLKDPPPRVRRPDVPAALADVIGRLLAKDPADRPVAAAVVTLLEHLQKPAGDPESDSPAPPAPHHAEPAPPVPATDAPASAGLATDAPAPPAGAPSAVPTGDTDGLDDPLGLDDFDFDDFADSRRAAPAPDLLRPDDPSTGAAPADDVALPTTPPPGTRPSDDVPSDDPSPGAASPEDPLPGDAAAPGDGSPPRPRRTLVYSTGGSGPARRRVRGRPALFVGLGVLVAGLTVVPIVLSQDGPAPSASTPPVAAAPQTGQTAAPPSNDPSTVNLRLAPPVDQGSHVQLTWQADGDLDFAVVVAGERIETMVLVANRQRTMRVPIDPARKYCFQIRATDGREVYTTEPLPIRGARCKV
ncbi:serine/threonine protein kinase [Dactylosporangium sp. CA-152071]|uniref:serine/threonine protein kinase n=1 Tax=Dactylosporangium sp. CA-152071 TaxID=3239933 RepID=UPI003D90B73F